MLAVITLIYCVIALHLTGFHTFFARFNARFAVIAVFSTLCNASLTAFHTYSAQFIAELRISCTQPCTKRTDVGAVDAYFSTSFHPCHGQAHSGAFFAFDHASQTSVNAIFHIFHLKKFSL